MCEGGGGVKIPRDWKCDTYPQCPRELDFCFSVLYFIEVR